jgi:hypothetical protein
MFNDSFKVVKVWDFFKRDEIIELSTEQEYKIYLKKNKLMVEVIGTTEQQIKPVIDWDAYDNDINIDEVKEILGHLFPNKRIAYANRNVRKHNGKDKYSYRFYVVGVRISWRNLRKLLEFYGYDKKKEIDVSIYKTDSQLFVVNTKYKYDRNTKEIYEVPELKVIEGSIFDCCASYIEEDYEDWNPIVEKLLKEKERDAEPIVKYEKIIKNDDEEVYSSKTIDFIKDIINHLSVKRATDYDDWIKCNFSIMGACRKSKIGKRGCCDLIHLFSALSRDKYEEDVVDKWIDDNYKKQMETDKRQYAYNYLIHTCLKEDNPDYYDDNFNKTYNKIKEEFEKEVIKIKDDTIYIQLNHNRDIHKPECYYIKNQRQLVHYYNDDDRYRYIKIQKDKKGNNIKHKLSIVDIRSEWWDDGNKRKVDRLVFQPFPLDEILNKRYYNMFQGFRVQFLPINKDYSLIQRILYHIKNVICNKDEYSYNWFLKYLSAILKGRKTNVFPMIRGLEGCGKNIILDMIAYGLIGDDYAIASSSPEKQLFNNFNSLLQNRVFTIINEGTNALRSCVDTIKDLVTEDKINIEKKGIDATTLRNYNNFIGNTNNYNILNVTPTDRRFVWFQCNNEFCGNMDYFNPLIEDVKDEKVLSAFYHYLIEEINCPDNFDFQKTRPKTSIYKKLQHINLPNPITYLCSIVNNKELLVYRKYGGIEYTTIKCADLYVRYKCWCVKTKYETYSYQQFETKILDDSKLGITKCADRNKFKIFKIVKSDFEKVINSYNDLEGLETLDDGFIHSDDEDDCED